MRILNDRVCGDSLGRPTFHGKNGISVADYIICNQNLLQKVKYLVVKSPNHLFDHNQVKTWINLHQINKIDNDIPLQALLSKSVKLQRKFNTFLDNDFSSDRECVNEFQNIIHYACKKTLKIKKKYRRTITNIANK